MVIILVVPILHFIIGWGYRSGNIWAWYFSLFEMLVISMLAIYLLVIGNFLGIIYIVFSVSVGVWLYKLHEHFIVTNA